MFFGYVSLSGTLFGMILAKAGETPSAADALPTYRIYGPAGTLMTNGTGTMTLGDQTGVYYFTHAITAGNGYAAGQTYTVKISYAVSAANKGEMATFTVV